jgi:TolB-like protein/class 3 adenylate cyclase/Flp pilus assembly protein TadD
MVRQLTAIMFTDMAGYTALMQRDEHQARANRERQRTVLEGEIVAHGGKLLQLYGDGSLSVFRSAIDAVRCAMSIQQALRVEPPISLRIGIHTGDVVHDDEGVFGDGVNVASRVQALAAPGGLLISGKVFDEVKNHPEIRTRSLGAFNLKHVQHPMKVFAITNDGLAVPAESDIASGRPTQTKSVAVLPFVNMSTDPENEFFSDGVTEEIINALTRVNGLKVTARTSSFVFKNRNEDVRAIAERLAVTHVLEGSVRRAGQRVRVTAQLICAGNGYHLFSDTYDRSIEDIFGVQDEIARTIVGQLASHLGPVRTGEEERAVRGGHSHDTEAYAEYLRGRFEWARFTPDGANRSLRHFERSIEMDPTCALPHTGLATSYVFLGAVGYMPPSECFPRAKAAARKALELEPDAGASHVALGAVKLFFDWDFEEAYRALQKALSLTPGSADAHHVYALYLEAIGDYEEAVEVMRSAVQLDPLSLVYNDSLAHALTRAGRLAEAREQIDRTLDLDAHFRSAIESSGWIYVLEGEYERAIEEFDRLPKEAGHEFAGAGDRGYAYGRAGRVDDSLRMLGLLEKRGRDKPDLTLDIDFALIHEGLGDRDKAFEYLERAVDKRMGTVVLLGAFAAFEGARSDPRFQALLDKIGLPAVVSA